MHHRQIQWGLSIFAMTNSYGSQKSPTLTSITLEEMSDRCSNCALMDRFDYKDSYLHHQGEDQDRILIVQPVESTNKVATIKICANETSALDARNESLTMKSSPVQKIKRIVCAKRGYRRREKKKKVLSK